VAEKSVIRTESAPAPFQGAPYSQAIRVGDLLFVAGQVPLGPGASELSGGTIEEQTEQVCENLKAILEAAGSSFDKVLKTTVFLTDLADFEGMNAVYRRYVGDDPPARSTVGIAALPQGARVEIEAVATV
jgi:2-iminobutanoate/2-iminopropanoate deaminase